METISSFSHDLYCNPKIQFISHTNHKNKTKHLILPNRNLNFHCNFKLLETLISQLNLILHPLSILFLATSHLFSFVVPSHWWWSRSHSLGYQSSWILILPLPPHIVSLFSHLSKLPRNIVYIHCLHVLSPLSFLKPPWSCVLPFQWSHFFQRSSMANWYTW